MHRRPLARTYQRDATRARLAALERERTQLLAQFPELRRRTLRREGTLVRGRIGSAFQTRSGEVH